MGLEGSDDVVEYLVAQEVMKDEVTLPEEKVKRIDAVTVDDVLRVAQDIFTDAKLNLAVVGPHDTRMRKRLEKILSL